MGAQQGQIQTPGRIAAAGPETISPPRRRGRWRVSEMADQMLRGTLAGMKQIVLSTPMLRNAMMDVTSTSEFTDLYEHEKMLSDQTRMRVYERAIARHIGPDDVVVDLGTGTGILALLAARQQPRRIHAIEHSAFIEVAEQIARHTTAHPIVFEQVNSRRFDPPEKVDVILHEQMGDELFEENMIENILDLRRRVLKEDGRIIPGRFELYIEPFTFKAGYEVPFLWDMQIGDIDLRFLRDNESLDRYQRRDHALTYLECNTISHFLCDPQPALSFDLNDRRFEGQIQLDRQVRTVSRAGMLDGACIYFRAIFDEENRFDTSPLNDVGSNWGNRYFRTPRVELAEGDQISFEIRMGNPVSPNTWELALLDPAGAGKIRA